MKFIKESLFNLVALLMVVFAGVYTFGLIVLQVLLLTAPIWILFVLFG